MGLPFNSVETMYNIAMRFRAFTMALIGLSLVTAAHSSLKSEVGALNKFLDAAFKKRDVNRYKKVIQGRASPDFVYTEGDMTMNFGQMMARMRQVLSGSSKLNVATQILSVKEHGPEGTVVERQSVAAIVKGQDKKPHSASYVLVYTDAYRKVSGRWMMASRSMVVEKQTADGKDLPVGGAKVRKPGDGRS